MYGTIFCSSASLRTQRSYDSYCQNGWPVRWRSLFASALDGLCDPSQWNVGLQEHVHVIRHDDVGPELAQPQLVLREAKSFNDGTGDSRISQPDGAEAGTIELTIHENECAAGRNGAVAVRNSWQ